jgi:D-glycero-alpha-D-manno-heptose-7-phosphate kinase
VAGKSEKRLVKIIHARAPIRINDLGGWTDTWFAGRGKVLNLAVYPAVEVQVKVYQNPGRARRRVMIHAENFRDTFLMDPDRPGRDRHPLLQFAIGEFRIPVDRRLDISLRSPVPAGISTGTSAAVCVALIGALDALQQKRRSWRQVARAAHRIETEKLGEQSGIQDQIAAVHGGITFIDIDPYPKSRVEAVRVAESTWRELDRRLCLVYLGRPHRSSAMHERVIARLKAEGPQMAHIRALAAIAGEARTHLEAGDLSAYGDDMIRNNERQRALSRGLVSRNADDVADVARKYGASGWKVNGAGGAGGSVTILASADDRLRRSMVENIQAMGRGIRTISVFLSAGGLQVWEI